MHARGLEPNYVFEINDTSTVLELVEAGFGVALVPEIIANLKGGLRRIPLRGRRWNWTIVAEALARSAESGRSGPVADAGDGRRVTRSLPWAAHGYPCAGRERGPAVLRRRPVEEPGDQVDQERPLAAESIRLEVSICAITRPRRVAHSSSPTTAT